MSNKSDEPKSCIRLEMPKEAVERLMEKWENDRENMIKEFKAMGFDIINIMPLIKNNP